MDEIKPAEQLKEQDWRRWAIYGGVALAIFLAGLLPMWLSARGARAQLEDVRQELIITRLQATLGSAVVDARRGNYEPARVAVSQFYTEIREQIDRGKASPFTPAQQAQANELFTNRDQLVTLLARGDPASGERLSDLYENYRRLLQGTVSGSVGGAGTNSR